MADDSLAEIEEYLRAYAEDERADVRRWAEQASFCLEDARAWLDEGAAVVTAYRRQSEPDYGVNDDKNGVAVDPAHPGMLIQNMLFMQHFLELLQVASALPDRDGKSLAKRHGYGQGPRGFRGGTDGEIVSTLLKHAVRQSNSQSERGKKGAALRHERSTRAAARKQVEALAHMTDALGEYLEPNELWPMFWQRLDAAELSPEDCGDHYSFEGGDYTYEAFRKQIRRLRSG